MCILIRAGYMSIASIDAVAVSRCYPVNSENYCFYSDSSVLSWNKAREFCARRNSTLPIITDEDVDNVFQQFIVSDSYSLIQNRSVWIAAHARPVNNSVSWHWIDGRTSGKPTDHRQLLGCKNKSVTNVTNSQFFFIRGIVFICITTALNNMQFRAVSLQLLNFFGLIIFESL